LSAERALRESAVKRPKTRKCLSLLSALESTSPAIFAIGAGVEVLEKVLLKKWVNWVFFMIVNI
jgi:hypothetical protein